MKKQLIYLLTLCSLSSCATMLSNTQTVRFQSSTEGATVKLNTRTLGNTNEQVTIEKKGIYGLVQVSKEGCKTAEFELPKKIDPVYYLNIFNLFIFAGFDFTNHSYLKTDKIIYVNDLDCTRK